MKYCLYASKSWITDSYGLNPNQPSNRIHHSKLPPVMHSGLTNWARVFDGHFQVPETLDDLRQYDVIHMNIAGNNIGRIKNLRMRINALPEEERPLIVVNPDQAIEMWHGFDRFDIFLQDMDLADRIFCVHPVMSDTLSTLMDRKVYHIQHPSDVDSMRELADQTREGAELSGKTITVVCHPYDQNYLIPSWTVRKIKQEMGDEVNLVLIGRVERDKPTLRMIYDEWYEVLPFHELLKVFAVSDVVIDTATTHSYGRVPMECRIINTQCVAHTHVKSALQHIDIYNAKKLYNAIKGCMEVPHINADMGLADYPTSQTRFEEMINGEG